MDELKKLTEPTPATCVEVAVMLLGLAHDRLNQAIALTQDEDLKERLEELKYSIGDTQSEADYMSQHLAKGEANRGTAPQN